MLQCKLIPKVLRGADPPHNSSRLPGSRRLQSLQASSPDATRPTASVNSFLRVQEAKQWSGSEALDTREALAWSWGGVAKIKNIPMLQNFLVYLLFQRRANACTAVIDAIVLYHFNQFGRGCDL